MHTFLSALTVDVIWCEGHLLQTDLPVMMDYDLESEAKIIPLSYLHQRILSQQQRTKLTNELKYSTNTHRLAEGVYFSLGSQEQCHTAGSEFQTSFVTKLLRLLRDISSSSHAPLQKAASSSSQNRCPDPRACCLMGRYRVGSHQGRDTLETRQINLPTLSFQEA